MRQLLIFRDIEDRHFGADADDHRHAHQGGDVEIDPGQPQPDEHRAGRQQRAADDDQRQREAAVEQEQQHELGDDRRSEHLGEAGEGDLLLLVQAAEIVADARRQHARFVQRGPDVGNCRTQAAADDPPGHRHHRLEILARDLRLAGHDADVGDARQREDVAVGGADRQAAELVLRDRGRVGQTDADVDDLVGLGQRGRDDAGQRPVERGLDVGGRRALEAGADRIDPHGERVAGELKPVLDLGDTGDLADQRRDLLRLCGQDRRIGGEEFDLDRLRHGGEIADQILHQLRHLDLDAGHARRDLAQHVGHHLFGGLGVARLQPDEIIAVIALPEIAAEPRTQPAREGLDVGIGLEQRIDLGHLAAALDQRGAGGGIIVHHEAALVDLGHEARRHPGIGDVAEREQRHRQHAEQPGPPDQPVERAVVAAREPAAAVRRGILPAVEIDKAACQQRHDERGHRPGDRQRRRHRQRQRLGEGAGHPGQERQRQEHDQRREARAGERRVELARRRQHRRVAGRRAVHRRGAGAARDMLDHHDHVVDQQPDRGGDPAQRHDVEAHPQQAEHQHRRRQRGRHHDHRDQRHADAAQEQQQHDRGEHQPDHHRIADARDRLRHQLALVVPAYQPDARRKFQSRELLANLFGDLHRIAVGLLENVEQHGRLAVLDDALPHRHDAGLHGRDVAHADDAGGRRLDDDVADRRRAHHAAIREHQRESPAILHLTDRAQHIAGLDRGGDVAHREARGEPMRIGEHLDLGGVAALDADAGEAGDRGEQRRHLIGREILERDRIGMIGDQRIGDDRKDGRVHSPDVVGGARRQARQRARDRGIDQQRARDHVAAPAEVDRDLRGAARRLGAYVGDAGDGAQHLLHRARHQHRGLVGGPAAGIEVDDDAREGDLREQPDRQRQRRDDPRQRQRQRDREQGARLGLDQRGEAHQRAACRTAPPSST